MMSATTGVKPRSSISLAVRGADAVISTRSPPSGTTWQPLPSSTERTAELIEDLGFTPVVADISEFEKLEGCVTCLSVMLPTR